MRGEWIEIYRKVYKYEYILSLPMRGEWIEMLVMWYGGSCTSRLSPCGESGLKCLPLSAILKKFAVSPHAGRVD